MTPLRSVAPVTDLTVPLRTGVIEMVYEKLALTSPENAITWSLSAGLGVDGV